MKIKLEKMLNDRMAQRDALNASMIESESKEERAAIGETLAALGREIAELEGMIAEADEPVEEQNDARSMVVIGKMQTREAAPVEDKAEARAAAFVKSNSMTIDNAEARATLVSAGTLATPTEVAGINDIVGARVSSIVDLVKVTNAEGMGAYKVAYQVSDPAAATQVEGEAYAEGDAVFGFVEIKPQTEAVLSYISKQARKQTPLAYTAKVNEAALVALRKRAAKVVTDAIVASDLCVDLALTAIDATTLRKIAFNYGGDEGIVGNATLFLNKKDLVKFGDARGQNEKKAVYEITPDAGNPNTGIIKDGGLAVPYCINGNLAEGTLLYGQGHNAELALFSNYEIAVSEDFAFNKGLLAIRGDVELGCGVVAAGGFVKATVA